MQSVPVFRNVQQHEAICAPFTVDVLNSVYLIEQFTRRVGCDLQQVLASESGNRFKLNSENENAGVISSVGELRV